MRKSMKVTLAAAALLGAVAFVPNTVSAQNWQTNFAYSDANGVVSAAPSNHVTIYLARTDAQEPLLEVRGFQFRVYFNTGGPVITDYLAPQGFSLSPFTKNPSAADDAADADGNPATNRFGVAIGSFDGTFPLRNNPNKLPAGWAPGQPTNGAFTPIVVTVFDGPGAAFGFTSTNPGNNTGFVVREVNSTTTGTATGPEDVVGMPQNGGVLAVEMASLDAKATGNGVLVTWETAMEIDNAGFNVYSQPEVATGLTKLNPILIGAAGTAASYSFADSRPLANGEVRAYYVEDVDVTGLATTLHGPAVVEGGASSNVSDWNLF